MSSPVIGGRDWADAVTRGRAHLKRIDGYLRELTRLSKAEPETQRLISLINTDLRGVLDTIHELELVGIDAKQERKGANSNEE